MIESNVMLSTLFLKLFLPNILFKTYSLASGKLSEQRGFHFHYNN